jgi:hypothetical protein
MALTTLLYIASQFPPQFCGVVAIILFLANNVLRISFHGNTLGIKVTNRHLSYVKSALIVSVILFIITLQALLFAYPLSTISILQTSFYAVLIGAGRLESHGPVPKNLIASVTWLNVLVLFFSLHPQVQAMAFFETPGGLRYQSIYIEPSYAAFIYLFNIVELIKIKRTEKVDGLIFLNILLIFITFSGSGLALLLLFLMAYVIEKFSFKSKLKVASVVIALLTTFIFSARSAFNEMVLSRWQGILTGDIDNSVFLRFVAPWVFLDQMAGRWVHFMAGVGIGGINEYINYYRSELAFLQFYDGSDATGLNNGYAVILAMMGFPFGFGLICLIIFLVWRSNSAISSKALLLAYPFFSGWIVHPLYILMLAIVIKKTAFKYRIG